LNTATAEQHQFAGVIHTFHESCNSGHGRVEQRRCWTFSQLDCLPQPGRWSKLRNFAVVERER